MELPRRQRLLEKDDLTYPVELTETLEHVQKQSASYNTAVTVAFSLAAEMKSNSGN